MTLPAEFITQIKAILGDRSEDFLNALDLPSPTSIRLNSLKNFSWRENSEKVKWNSSGVYLKDRPSFTLDPAFHAGAYYVQEASSMLLEAVIRKVVDVEHPLKVLDLCAAPGGKSTLLASLMTPDSFLLANEVIKSRYQILKQNLVKWGNPVTHASNHDSKDFAGLSNFFDLVVVDAPCSGEGLFRKDQAAIAEWSPANVQLCSLRQRRILAEAIKTVRPGGHLIYCTCTYNELENDLNAKWLSTEFDFEVVSIDFPAEWGISTRSVGYQCYPHLVQGEGFYIVIFHKKGEAGMYKKPLGKFRKWFPLTKKEVAMVHPWLNTDAKVSLFRNERGMVRGILESNLEAAFEVAQHLSRIAMGTEIGILKHKDFVPSPDLALSTLVSNNLPSIDLNKEQALHFLSKEPIPLETIPQGWQLIRYEGLNLGWVKGLKNRINNYYPKEWRIKMSWK